MIYTDRVLKNARFLECMRQVKICEKDRPYCHHELEHALDVCRMTWILYLENLIRTRTDWKEETMDEMKDHIYVAGLLHDIGRAAQYQTGEHHSIVGMRIAEQILEEIAYPSARRVEILRIVAEHHGRDKDADGNASIGEMLYRADQLSRNCFLCEAVDTCKWLAEERNQTILL